MKKEFSMSSLLKETAEYLSTLSRQLDELEKVAKEGLPFIKGIAGDIANMEKVEIRMEDYESLAVVLSEFREIIKASPEPLKSVMEYSYGIGFIAGVVKSKGVIV